MGSEGLHEIFQQKKMLLHWLSTFPKKYDPLDNNVIYRAL